MTVDLDKLAAGARGWVLRALLLVIAAWALWPGTVAAQQEQVLVYNESPYPLLVNGNEVVQYPALVEPGGVVCATVTVGHTSDVERLVFSGWSNAIVDSCVTLTEPGSYTALYTQEVLLTIRSEAKSYRSSEWVTRGSVVSLIVPEVVEEETGVRYLFEEWTGGESRFSPQNQIAPNRPMTLEAKWRKEILVTMEGPEQARLVGGGWHSVRDTVVISASPTVESPDEGAQLQFLRWDVVSNPALNIPNRSQPITSVRIDAPHTLRAVYEKAYWVILENPLGLIKSEWVRDGKQLPVETPEAIEISPDRERYGFRGWKGVDVVAAKGFLTVDGPTQAEALYDREFKVTVLSPYGSTGDGWYAEGETATIQVPTNPSSILFLHKVFRGFAGYPGTNTTLGVPVTEPLTLTASYSTEVETRGLAITAAVVVALALFYLVTQRIFRRRVEEEP